jgi:hypothetical protein
MDVVRTLHQGGGYLTDHALHTRSQLFQEGVGRWHYADILIMAISCTPIRAVLMSDPPVWD